MALIDVFHQLHCLDNMRRAIFPEYYGNLNHHFRNSTFPFEDHTAHCQYVLMKALTCHADAEMTTFNKIQGYLGPFQDFSLDRKCRDFDALLKFKDESDRWMTDEEETNKKEGKG